MDNAELIDGLRWCANTNCIVCLRRVTGKCTKDRLCTDAADALEAAEKRIAELEAQLPKRGAIMLDEMPKRILGYDAEKLILFAMMCEKSDVRETDLKQAAWNLELAVRAVMNERAEIVKNTMDEISVRFTPDFEKAFEEMMPNCGAKMKGEQK